MQSSVESTHREFLYYKFHMLSSVKNKLSLVDSIHKPPSVPCFHMISSVYIVSSATNNRELCTCYCQQKAKTNHLQQIVFTTHLQFHAFMHDIFSRQFNLLHKGRFLSYLKIYHYKKIKILVETVKLAGCMRHLYILQLPYTVISCSLCKLKYGYHNQTPFSLTSFKNTFQL